MQGVRLSRRETQVINLLARGLACKQIASEVGLSVYTVDKYKRRAFVKTGAHSTLEAIWRLGMVTLLPETPDFDLSRRR